MFVGHYAVAVALVALVPGVDPLVALVGVGLPDLLLGVLVLAGVEDISRDPESPLWTDVTFEHYPYSHSLVLGGAMWTVAALPVVAVAGVTAGAVFVAAALSHWLLDVVVHDGDLPVLGVGDDWTLGLGLWRRPALAFLVEYLLFGVAVVAVLPRAAWPAVLAVGLAAHLLTVNPSFGLARTNPVYDAVASRLAPRYGTDRPGVTRTLFALQVLGGYVGIVAALRVVLGA